MSEILEKLLKKRGFSSDFLRPQYRAGAVYLPDIEKAVARIKQAVKAKEKVLIYGDYDVDGVTATALMLDALKLAGVAEVEMMLPDRFVDGYGMSERVVDQAQKLGVSLVVTVDCGSNNAEVCAELAAAGVDVIVTDHHEVMGELPAAVAVVNPKRADFVASVEGEEFENGDGKYGPEELRELAGVGVAFILAKALVAAGLIPAGQEKWLLDLVLIGTICDSMVLTGVNRELCYYGMKVLAKTRRAGLVELIRVAKVGEINARAIGFQIGPRLNAGGRMESAEISLKLLTTKSKAEAARLAAKLDQLNSERRLEQQAALKEIGKMEGATEAPVIVVAGKWHEGVLGIIAGRLVEKYHKPAFVLAEVPTLDGDNDGMVDGVVLKGSGRSFGDFSLAEALKKCKRVIISGGGHAGACGVKIEKGKMKDFAKKVNEYYASLKLEGQEKYLEVSEDVVVDGLDGADVKLMDELAELEPFGSGNEEPVFCLRQMFVLDVAAMGASKQHLRVEVRDEKGGVMKLVAFSAPEEWFALPRGEFRDFWVRFDKNEWQGKTRVEGMILRVG